MRTRLRTFARGLVYLRPKLQQCSGECRFERSHDGSLPIGARLCLATGVEAPE